MTFLHEILDRLGELPEHPFLQRVEGEKLRASTGRELLDRVRRVRAFARANGLAKGDRCGLLGTNGPDWVAADLGLMAEGALVVPLYARQTPSEQARILRDAAPALVLSESEDDARALRAEWPDAPVRGLSEALETAPSPDEPPHVDASDPVSIVYTSGTSGEPKGVVLGASGLGFMLERTSGHLDALMEGHEGPERVYHYLPFCFAGSWILLLLSLSRGSVLTLNTDLSRIVDELARVRPHYFQNVPVLLDRMRDGVEQAVARRGGHARNLFDRSRVATLLAAEGTKPGWVDNLSLALARKTMFPKIREKIGPALRALICGSAPLSRETQLFFEMLGVPVLQVYGLTETTAICTMDRPGEARVGCVGRAIEGVEMRLGDDDEILVRGPNLFAGYWNREDATRESFRDGWFRTGDVGAVDGDGYWRILGRLKNVLVPTSGHNVAPEPIEESLAALLPEASQILVIGTGRPHLAVIVTGDVDPDELESALEMLNVSLPHYRKVRSSIVVPQPFTVESGLVTANGKLRRSAIEERLAPQIAELYERASAERQEKVRA